MALNTPELIRFMAQRVMFLVVVAAMTACQIGGGNSPQQFNATLPGQDSRTLRLEIPAAEWEPAFFKALEERTKQVNWPSLRAVLLPRDDLEMRFWYDGRPDIINGFVIRRSGGQWSAVGIRQRGERHYPVVEQEGLGTPKSGWEVAWKRFVEAGILTLPDESKVNCRVEVLDGGGFVVETSVAGMYRTYRYSNPQLAKCDEAKRVMSMDEIIADEFSLNIE